MTVNITAACELPAKASEATTKPTRKLARVRERVMEVIVSDVSDVSDVSEYLTSKRIIIGSTDTRRFFLVDT
jgi:hypothetical protein